MAKPYVAAYQARLQERRRDDERQQEKWQALHNRAERAELAQGIGRCDGCAFWHRGPRTPSITSRANFKWGYCRANVEVIEFSCEPWRGEPEQEFVTSEGFGCVLFWDGKDRLANPEASR